VPTVAMQQDCDSGRDRPHVAKRSDHASR